MPYLNYLTPYDIDYNDYDLDPYWEDCLQNQDDFNPLEEFFGDYYYEDEQYIDIREEMYLYEENLNREDDFIDREYHLPCLRKDWRNLRIREDVRDFLMKRPQKRHHEDKLKRQFMAKRRQARKHKHDLCYGGYEEKMDAIFPPFQIEDFCDFEAYNRHVATEMYARYKLEFNRITGLTIHQLLGYK